MKKSNVITDIYSSIFNLKNYARFAKEKTSKTVLYLLLVTTLLSMIVIYKPFKEISSFLGFINEQKIIEKMPEFSFEDGLLSVDSKEPFTVSDNGIIFSVNTDMSQSAVEKEFLFYDTGIILTKDVAYFRFGGALSGLRYNFQLPVGGVELSSLNSQSLYDALYIMASAPVLLFIPWVISLLVSNLTFIFLVAFMFSITANRSVVKFSEIFKLAVHACTLSLIFKTFELSMFMPTFLSTLVIYLIAYIYTNNGLKLLTKERLKA